MKETRDYTPDEAVAFAIKLAVSGDLENAEGMLRAVLKVAPGHARAQTELGNVRFRRGDRYEALYRFDRALRADKRLAVARSKRGMILSELGHLDEAEADIRMAMHHGGDRHATVWNNLANVLERQEKLGEALRAIEKTLALDPNHALSYFNKGCILVAMDDHVGALRAFDASLALDLTNQEAHYNRAITLLKMGRLEEGFAAYDARLLTSGDPIYYVRSEAPRWRGESLDGKTILLHAEQGIGDTIQFLRYVDCIRFQRRTALVKILLIVHTALKEICRETYAGSNIEVLDTDTEIPPHDFVCPLMSLPAVFKTTIETIPPRWHFSEPSPCEDCARWDGLVWNHPTLRVGICWSGNFQHKNDAHRSIPLATFSELLGVSGVRYYSLQKDVRLEDSREFEPLPAAGLVDLAPHLTDMRQTAHAMGRLDLVITVDTAVAHLAATMGVETWILLPKFKSDWRWLTGRSDTPWYPGVTLFRQETKGDWAAVMRDVRARLERRTQQAAA